MSSIAATCCLHRGRQSRPAPPTRTSEGPRSQPHRSPGPGGVAGRILALLLLLAMAEGARAEAPLVTADIVRFLRAGISERTILAELRERGFAELLDWPRETAIREAGASETLVVALRRAPPPDNGSTAPPSTTPTPSRGSPPPGPTAGRGSPPPPLAAATPPARVPLSVPVQNAQAPASASHAGIPG